MSKPAQVLVFGGTGFVGTHVLKQLSSIGVQAVSFSRQGLIPKHLEKAEWATGHSSNCRFLKADALRAYEYKSYMEDNNNDIASVVVLVGSPPVPTFNDHDYEQQFEFNGTACSTIIDTAAECGIKQIVLLNASVPSWAPAGYREGKMAARESAEQFSELSPEHGAAILYPGGIYGTRYTASGIPIPLQVPMLPASYTLSLTAKLGINQALERTSPYLFKDFLCPMVSVERVSSKIVDAATKSEYFSKLTHISNDDILDP
mmetsp:Transcript_16078/g.18203  ORF Transcript_16078/g.18203 Transcript_16078/m.18203 type:complete len:260 (+) Transcript_16078:227-1006(+)